MGEVLAVVGLVFAIPPVIEQIVKAGSELARRVKLCRGLPESLDGLSVFQDEAVKTKLRFELGYKICNSPDPTIDEEIRNHLDQKFQDIQRTINDAGFFIAKLEKGSLRNFWKLDQLRKDLENRTQALKAAVESFNDTINLVHIEQAGTPNAKLTDDVFQLSPEPQAVITENSWLVRCHLARDSNKVKAKKGLFLVEPRPYKPAMKQSLENSLSYLAKNLIDSKLSEFTLRAAGYADDAERRRFFLVFDVPSSLKSAGTLQTLLQGPTPKPPLNTRVSLCNKLANAVFEVHSLRMVHKNVNSGNVLVMTAADTDMSRAADKDIRPFLLNWHLVRKVDVASVPSPERKWWKGIYQHPGRQIALTEDEYNMGHDVYSLGVCMLETLLWTPLVRFKQDSDPTICDEFASEAVLLGVAQPGGVEAFLDDPDDTRDMQKILLAIANKSLPAAAGQRLTNLVKSCLTCLENGFGDLSFGPGTNRVEVGMNYVTAVKNSLSEICI